jgi:hypothetical protein
MVGTAAPLGIEKSSCIVRSEFAHLQSRNHLTYDPADPVCLTFGFTDDRTWQYGVGRHSCRQVRNNGQTENLSTQLPSSNRLHCA